jgi:thioredoxin-related protein
MSILKILILFLLISFITLSCDQSNDSRNTLDETEQSESKVNNTEQSEICEITCPYCGHKKKESLPTEVCQIRYECENCSKTLTPEGGDCCVFCTHSTHKCPSKQVE